MLKLRFSRGSGLAGAIVRADTWSEFAHVGFKLSSGLVLDATPGLGVTYRDPKDTPDVEYWRLISPPAGVQEAALAWARLQVGKPYDWTAIAGFLFRRDWHRDDRWFCSEFIAEAFHRAGWPLTGGCAFVNRITPRDLTLSDRIAPCGTVPT